MKIKYPKFYIKSSCPLDKNFKRTLEIAYSKNAEVFKNQLPEIKAIISHSAEEWKRHTSYYHFSFARGVVMRDATMVIKSRKLCGLTPKQYQQLATHEMSHVFWAKLLKRGRNLWSPIWLVEALACLTANNSYLLSRAALKFALKTKETPKLLYRYRSSDLNTREQITLYYSVWTEFLRFLIRRNQRAVPQLIQILSKDKDKTRYQKAFLSTFGDTEKSLYEKFFLSYS